MQEELDESVGCCLAYVEDLAIRQHLVQSPLQLERLVWLWHVLMMVWNQQFPSNGIEFAIWFISGSSIL